MIMQLLAVLLLRLAAALASNPLHYLNATAIVSDSDGNARIQCWQFEAPFQTYPTVGMAIHLGQVSNLTYVALPPRSKKGLHKPPHPMFFVLLSGLAHVTLPNGTDDVWILEGVNQLIVAADTVGRGHFTDYPSDKVTVALQIPFANKIAPDHKVLRDGACESAQVVHHTERFGAGANELKRRIGDEQVDRSI